jgi:hypothetical protein
MTAEAIRGGRATIGLVRFRLASAVQRQEPPLRGNNLFSPTSSLQRKLMQQGKALMRDLDGAAQVRPVHLAHLAFLVGLVLPGESTQTTRIRSSATQLDESDAARWDREYDQLYPELVKVAPPPMGQSSDDWSLHDEYWVHERIEEAIGPRPDNVLWSLVLLYGPGAGGSVLGEVGSLGRQAQQEMAGTIRSVNPMRGSPNCVNCSIATDYTLAGNPTVAGPEGPYILPELAAWMGGTFVPVMDEVQIASMLSRSGNGAQGIVYGEPLVRGQLATFGML